MKGTPTRNRYSPVVIRGARLGLPTGEDLMENEEAALNGMPRGTDLPYDDGEPMESPWHRNEMYLLIDSLATHWKDRDDVFIGGNMFVYYSDKQEFNRDFRGPDFFVVKGVERDKNRASWISWDERGRLPDLIIELLSQSTKSIDRGEKKKLYCETFRVHEYFCYDPEEELLEGWRRMEGSRYEAIDVEPNGRMRSEALDLTLGIWEGRFIDLAARWLRFFSNGGKVVTTARELEATGRAREAAGRVKEVKARKAAEAKLEHLERELAALRKKRKNT